MDDLFFWNVREEEMRNRKSHDEDGKDQDEVHARMRDEESADGRGDEEDDTRRRADESVRLVTRIFGDEDGDQCREGDATQVACDHAEEQKRDERPQSGACGVLPCFGWGGDIHHEAKHVNDERDEARSDHDILFLVMVNETSKPDA